MSQEFNAGLALLEASRKQPLAIAIRDDQTAFTYESLAIACVRTAQHLQQLGAGPGKLIAVRSDDLLLLMATVFGSALAGCQWVFASEQTLKNRLLKPDLVFDGSVDPTTRMKDAIAIDESWALPLKGSAGSALPVFQGYASPDDVWLISPTSGTSGTPKLVGLSHRVVAFRNEANKEWFDRPGRKISGLFPIAAPALLSRYISALVHGGEIVSSLDPQQWVAHDVDLVFGSPAQIRIVMSDVELPKKLPRIHMSGSTAPEKLVRHLLNSFDTVANGYGSTEAHNCMSMNKTLASNGELKTVTTLRDVDVEIVDENDTPLPVGREGIVRIRSARTVDRYLDNPDATAVSFRHGYFYPGDIGKWTNDGQFEVTGRVNDMFNLGGVKLNASLLDFTLLSVPGIDDAICFLVQEKDGTDALRAMVTIAPGYEADTVLADARIALIRAGGADAVPKKFLFSKTLPRNANGKADRSACAQIVRRHKDEQSNDPARASS